MKKISILLLLLLLIGCSSPSNKITCLSYYDNSQRLLVYFSVLVDKDHHNMMYPVIHDIYISDTTIPDRPFIQGDLKISAASNIKTYRTFRENLEKSVSAYEVRYFDIGQAMIFAYLDSPSNCVEEKTKGIYRIPNVLVEVYYSKLKDRRIKPKVFDTNNITWYTNAPKESNEESNE